MWSEPGYPPHAYFESAQPHYGEEADASQWAREAAHTLGYDYVNEQMRHAEQQGHRHAREHAERLAGEAAHWREAQRRQEEWAWYANGSGTDEFEFHRRPADFGPHEQRLVRPCDPEPATAAPQYRPAHVLVDRESHSGDVRVALGAPVVVIRGFHRSAVVMNRCRTLGATAIDRPNVAVVRFAVGPLSGRTVYAMDDVNLSWALDRIRDRLIWRARRLTSPLPKGAKTALEMSVPGTPEQIAAAARRIGAVCEHEGASKYVIRLRGVSDDGRYLIVPWGRLKDIEALLAGATFAA